jgi:hypothetical protein
VSSIAIIDGRGTVVSGTGNEQELAILRRVAAPAAQGKLNAICERLIKGTDVVARPISGPQGTLYLAALGERVARMGEAAKSAERILRVA